MCTDLGRQRPRGKPSRSAGQRKRIRPEVFHSLARNLLSTAQSLPPQIPMSRAIAMHQPTEQRSVYITYSAVWPTCCYIRRSIARSGVHLGPDRDAAVCGSHLPLCIPAGGVAVGVDCAAFDIGVTPRCAAAEKCNRYSMTDGAVDAEPRNLEPHTFVSRSSEMA